jgi:DNA polymerase-3 subunit alpha
MTIFSELLATSRDLLGSGKPLLISADARIEEESVKLLAQTIRSLDDAVAHAAAGLKIAVNDLAALPGLTTTIAAERKGRGRIAVVVDLGEEGEVEIALPGAYAIAAQTRSKLATLPGVTEVQEL